MKSHELAKLLLEQPDLEVFAEVESWGELGRQFNTVNFDGKTQITPSGIFLSPAKFFKKGFSDKSPNDEPVLGSFLLFMSDGLVLKHKNDGSRISERTVKYLSTGESKDKPPTVSICGQHIITVEHDNHMVFHRPYESHIVLVTNKETYEQNPLYSSDDTKYEHRYLEDIDYVKVLVSYDELTWKPEYKSMSYAEALAYGKTL